MYKYMSIHIFKYVKINGIIIIMCYGSKNPPSFLHLLI